ncbi:hypothetical protein KAS79_00365 [Candidatus Parcubacteria bacterium]|nr:hypothetical protein [Candidatus Parcubacteria bacterium]
MIAIGKTNLIGDIPGNLSRVILGKDFCMENGALLKIKEERKETLKRIKRNVERQRP